MWKKRLLVGIALLLTVLFCVVVLDPTCVLLGWLSGESFYQGRPTAYWSRQLRSARAEAIAKATAGFSPSPSPSSWPSWTGSTPPPPPLPPWMLSRLVKEPDSKLQRTRDDAAIPVLLELLRDYDPWVRWRVAIALSVILQALPREKVEGLGHQQLERLVSTLEEGFSPSSDEEQRRKTGEALARLSPLVPSAVPGLFRFVRNETPAFGTFEQRLFFLLGRVGHQTLSRPEKMLLPSLIELLKGEDIEAGKDACCLLGSFGPDACIAGPALQNALAVRELRVKAAEALWRIEPGNTVTVPALVQQLQDGDTSQRLEAVNALGRLGSRSAPAVLPLAGMLQEVQGQLSRREKGEPAVVVLDEGDLADIIDSEEGLLRLAILNAFRDIGPTAISALEAAEQDTDPEVRRQATTALKRIRERAR